MKHVVCVHTAMALVEQRRPWCEGLAFVLGTIVPIG